MSMNRWMKVSCVALVAASGCTGSQVDPELEIQLSGKVLKEDGQPLADTLLKMNRSANSSCLFSLFGGLDWKSMKTKTDGTFSEELLGADTQAGGLARCFEVRIPRTGTGGNYGYASFIIQTEAVQLPLLQQWTGKPSAAAGADGVSVSYEGLTATQTGNSGTHTLTVTDSSGSIWVSRNVSSPVPLNDDLLEDAANLKARASILREAELNKTKFSLYNEGDDVALPKRARVPLSRGASCTYPEAPATCPMTDGNLSSVVNFKQGTLEVAIPLPQPKVLRKAVVRKLDMSFGATTKELVLEGSTDGSTWVVLANLLGSQSIVQPFYEATLSHPTALSHVRLRAAGTPINAENPFYIAQLSELSFFE
ncbi:hypothetical protein KYC5002_34170 [Archangium violaceum]|uniref:hypothetical protein n=1 Tax=Archangium violaceum TaxID=83451 RepID=UPI002B2A7DE0|nr:hypothetical protein KYC5002_34170 [Archangium gephyra]